MTIFWTLTRVTRRRGREQAGALGLAFKWDFENLEFTIMI